MQFRIVKKNELINEINKLIHDYYADNSSVEILSLNANIKGAIINQSDEHRDNKGDYNHLYFGNVHLNHQHGVLLLKNWLLSHLLMTSNCSTCPQGLYQNKAIAAKAPVVRFQQNYRHRPFNATKTSTSAFNYDRNSNYSYRNYNNNFHPKLHYGYYP